jgi:polynucleotide 5'-hydroxyl-kinase GRC3/NOL9
MILDCDAGQPECSPPGMLTLTKLDQPILTPPHLHMADNHVGAYFFGHTTSKADPTMYLEMVTQLLQKYTDIVNQEHGGDGTKLPLLINTDGWVKGLGMEILATLLHNLAPNHVIQILGDCRSKQFDLPFSATTKLHLARAYNVDSPVDLGTALSIPSPAYRSLRLCTYFLQTTSIWDHCDFGQYGIIDDDNEIAHGLASAIPVVVSMDAVHVSWRGDCAAAATTTTPDQQHFLWNALNGSVVGLCDDRNGGTCRGLGIVRSIDPHNRLAYLLTPVPMKDLMTVDALIGGGIPLGRECYFRGVHSESFPFVTCDGVTAGIGGDVMKSRNTLIRKGGN